MWDVWHIVWWTYLVVDCLAFTWRMDASNDIAVECLVREFFAANNWLIGLFNGTVNRIDFVISFMSRSIDHCQFIARNQRFMMQIIEIDLIAIATVFVLAVVLIAILVMQMLID